MANLPSWLDDNNGKRRMLRGLEDFDLQRIILEYSGELVIIYEFDLASNQQWFWKREMHRRGVPVWTFRSVRRFEALPDCINDALENAQLCGEVG